MHRILIAELFETLQGCLEDHIEAGRQGEAIQLVKKLRKLNRDFAKRGERILGIQDLPSPFKLVMDN